MASIDDVRAEIARRELARREEAKATAKAKADEQPGALESLGRGAAQGVSFGFGDEISGAIAAGATKLGLAGDGVAPEFQLEPGEAYDSGRDAARDADKKASDAGGKAYGAGRLAGTVLGSALPVARAGKALAAVGKAVGGGAKGLGAVGALLGAGTGAVAGAGDAGELGDTAGEALEQGAIGALAGGVLGPLVPALGRAAVKGVGRAKNAIAGALGRAGKDADRLRVLTTMGATGGSINTPAVLREAERVPGGIEEVARVLRALGISKGITTTSGIAKRAAAAQDKSGKEIGQMIDDASARNGVVDTDALTARLRSAAAEATSGMQSVSEVARQHARALSRAADNIDEAAVGGVAPIDSVKALSRGLSDDAAAAYEAKAAGRMVAGKGRALMDTRRELENGIGDALEDVGLDRAAYNASKRTNQVSRIASEAAETSQGRANKNGLIGLTTATLAQSNVVAAVLHQVLKPLGASTRATLAERAQSMSQAAWAERARAVAKAAADNPGAARQLGPEGEALAEAAGRGGAALAAAYADLRGDQAESPTPPSVRSLRGGRIAALDEMGREGRGPRGR